MFVKSRTNFSRDDHRTAVLGTAKNYEIDENNKDQMALLRYHSVFHGNLNKPAIHEAFTVTSVKQFNFLWLNLCEDKWYHKLNAQINKKDKWHHKLNAQKYKHDPAKREINFVSHLLSVDVCQFSPPVCGRFRFRQSQCFK